MFALLFAAVFAGSIVEDINNDPTSTWIAVEYHPSIITPARFRAMLGAIIPPVVPTFFTGPYGSHPADFDARKQWGNKIMPVRNQGSCGSCWAFSVAETVGDRENIAGCVHGDLAPQDLVSCDTTDLGCSGGYMDRAWNWARDHGLAEEGCITYTSGGGKVESCPGKCRNGSAIVRHKVHDWHFCANPDEMMEQVANHGPISVTFEVYQDFMNYKSGVYEHKSGTLEGAHAVLLLGYGTENGTPYWLCQNSWGNGWGEQGFFKILRRGNHCGIEGQAAAPTIQCPN